MLNIVILGAPGSGKGTLSKSIIEKYGLHHISTGDVLREEMENQTVLGEIAKEYIHAGKLVPDQLIIDMIPDVLDKIPNPKGYIFDGFPRTITQAQALDELLRERNTPITAVLMLLVDEDVLIQRILKRSNLENRTDDTLETVQKRLEVYKNQTEPLKEYYKKMGKLFKIKGGGTPADTFEHAAEVIDRLVY